MREGPSGHPLSTASTRAIPEDRSVPTHLAFCSCRRSISRGCARPAAQPGLSTAAGGACAVAGCPGEQSRRRCQASEGPAWLLSLRAQPAQVLGRAWGREGLRPAFCHTAVTPLGSGPTPPRINFTSATFPRSQLHLCPDSDDVSPLCSCRGAVE